MPVGRQPSAPRPAPGPTSHLWPSGGVHQWQPGATSTAHAHHRGHLVYAARGVLSIHTEQSTSVVPADRVAWIPAGFSHHHRAHGHTDMRIVFLPASPARLLPGHPVVFLASDLVREILLTLTGPRYDDPTEDDPRRTARARLHRVLVDELHEAPEQPLQLPEPRDDRLRAVAQRLYEHPADHTPLAELGHSIGASARTLSRLPATGTMSVVVEPTSTNSAVPHSRATRDALACQFADAMSSTYLPALSGLMKPALPA